MSLRGLSLAVLSLAAVMANAQALRYVSDELVVNVRTGESNSHAIVRMLNAGTAVEVLERNEDSGYSRVRVPDRDTEGWILSQYLTAEPIARDKLASAERELDGARARIAELEAHVAALTEDIGLTSEKLEQRESAHAELSNELADVRRASANAIALRDDNQLLQRRLDERNEEMRRLTQENATLASRERQTWFISGATVMLGGIALGLVLPHMRRRRRTDW